MLLKQFPDLATGRAHKVMALANQEAKDLNHQYIGTEHILLGLIREGSGIGTNVLKSFNLELDKVRSEIVKLVKVGPEIIYADQLPLTSRAKKVIEYALEEMKALEHNYVGTEHLLLGLLREQDGVAAQVLMCLDLRLEDIRGEILHILDAKEEKEKTVEKSLVRIADVLEEISVSLQKLVVKIK